MCQRLAEASDGLGGCDQIGAGEQHEEQRKAGGQGLDGPQTREWRCDDRADLKGDQRDERHQPDDQHRDGDTGREAVQGQQIADDDQRGGGSRCPQHSPHDLAGWGPVSGDLSGQISPVWG